MSVHYETPIRFKNCHIHNILRDATKKSIDINELGIIVNIDDMTEQQLKRFPDLMESVSVSYDKRIIKVSGRDVNSCSKTLIDYHHLDNRYYYPIYDVEDYGDEGNSEISSFLISKNDLIETYSFAFDEIIRI